LSPILLLTPGAGQTPACRNRRSPYLFPRRPAQRDYRWLDPTEAPCCSGLHLEVKSANHPTEPQEVIHMVEVRAAGHESSLSFGTGARRRHELTHRDDTEIASILDFLEILPDQALAGLRVLELACGSGRTTVPMAAAGHHVLATDISIDVLDLLADRLKERRAIQSGAVDPETGEIFELERRGQQRLID